MRLKAIFTVEIEAEDFVSAADHQKRLEQILLAVRDEFPQAELKLTERRTRRSAPVRGFVPRAMITGRLHDYSND
ncbi:MAG: hypothetical protein Q8S03_16075 [Brevundimonas sp.]|uniref:hypothetical protein n=1 Tax=Brevundimonas sp. TaxID=1871086 RepID=UPI00273553A2|nr:hypothetical protein [Brevundimonas sp.]MDP3406207.1 hypothetical protein [Brevundimonas sp.]